MKLPPEIVVIIAHFLDTASLDSFRRTSKFNRWASKPAYAACHFSVLELDFSSESLNRLSKVADDECYRSYVRELLVVVRPLREYWAPGNWSLQADNSFFHLAAPKSRMVVQAISTFHHCTSVSILEPCPVPVRPDQHPPPLSTLNATFLVLSTLRLEDGPPFKKVSILDRTPWSVAPGPLHTTHALGVMASSPIFAKHWGLVEDFRYV